MLIKLVCITSPKQLLKFIVTKLLFYLFGLSYAHEDHLAGYNGSKSIPILGISCAHLCCPNADSVANRIKEMGLYDFL